MRALLLSFLFCTSLSPAQTLSSSAIDVSSETAPPIVHKTEPVYPPIAKAAHVSGKVVLKVEVSETGAVIHEKLVSGPPMLVGAAEDAVRQWKYAPYVKDGHALPATFSVTVPFDLPAPANPDDEQIARTFSTLR